MLLIILSRFGDCSPCWKEVKTFFQIRMILMWWHLGFIQALFLTSVFCEGLSFMDVGHNLTCVSILTIAAVGSRGCCKSPFGYFSDPRFSNSLPKKTSCEHILMLKQGVKTTLNLFEHLLWLNFFSSSSDFMQTRS